MYVYAAALSTIASYFIVGHCMYMAITKDEPGDGSQFTKDLFIVYHHASEHASYSVH